jgi:hypothetical protein
LLHSQVEFLQQAESNEINGVAEDVPAATNRTEDG